MSTLPTVLTGIRANNRLHIGNYLGALLPIVKFAQHNADSHTINLFVPDLHSITTPIAYDKLQDGIIDTVRTYMALGLPVDHDNVHVYRQSYISAHSELAWILSCFTGFGEMRRMTQFKDKSQDITNRALAEGTNLAPVEGDQHPGATSIEETGKNVSVGLFNYPILMATDILLYDASYVPVGDDQSQHLEFTRDIAQRMNNLSGKELFVVPKTVKEQHRFFGKDNGLRIRDLVHPEKKMSKSDESGKGVIFLDDDTSLVRKKIMSATTDSYAKIEHDYSARPGISNLLDLLDLFGGDSAPFIGQQQYGQLKEAVSDVVVAFLEEFNRAKQSVTRDDAVLLLQSSETIVRATAEDKLRRVQAAVGLRAPK